MAQAIVIGMIDKQQQPDTTANWNFNVAFFGADVGPTVEDSATITINVDSNVTLAAIGTKLAAAVRANATQKGLTIPANKVFIPSYSQA